MGMCHKDGLKMYNVRRKMGNPHIDSVERNGAGITIYTLKGEP